MKTTMKTSVAAIACLSAFLLVGCSSTDDDATDTTSSSSTEADSSKSDDTASDDAKADDSEAATTGSAAGDAYLDCLADAGYVIKDDGSFEFTSDDLSLAVGADGSYSLKTDEGEVTVGIDGTITGDPALISSTSAEVQKAMTDQATVAADCAAKG
jgi:hypothetical protein